MKASHLSLAGVIILGLLILTTQIELFKDTSVTQHGLSAGHIAVEPETQPTVRNALSLDDPKENEDQPLQEQSNLEPSPVPEPSHHTPKIPESHYINIPPAPPPQKPKETNNQPDPDFGKVRLAMDSEEAKQYLKTAKTTHHCYTFSDYSELCVYENLCHDGLYIMLLDPNSSVTAPRLLRGTEYGNTKDDRYYDIYPWPIKPPQYIPNHSSYYNGAMEVGPNVIENKTIEFLDGTIWYGPSDGSANNVWHYSSQNMNLWEAKMLNETLPEGAKLPPMDYFLSRRDFIAPGWEAGVMELLTQPHTKFLLREWIYNPEDFKPELLPAWYTNRDESRFNHSLQVLFRGADEPSIGPDRWVCSKKAILFGQKIRLFSGVYPSHRWKMEAFEKYNLPIPPPRGNQVGGKTGNSLKVVVDHRPQGFSRALFNLAEVEELLHYYGLDVSVHLAWEHMTPFVEQIKLMMDADLFIIVHGAGGVNIMWMPYRANVIEIFPYGYRPPMYEYLATAMGLHYIGIPSLLKGRLEVDACGGELYSDDYYNRCQNLSAPDHLVNTCGSYTKNSCVVAPIPELESAIIDAFDHIGVNLNIRVDKRFSDTRHFRRNDFHDPANFYWTSNPWERGVTNPKTYQQHLQELAEAEANNAEANSSNNK
jgi:hypothetical protein